MGVLITKILGTPDFGPYLLAGEEYVLIHAGMRVDPRGVEEIKKALGVEQVVFYEPRWEIGNDYGLVFSHVVPEDEVRYIAKSLSDLGIDLNVAIVETRFTALRNNLLINNHGGIVNPDMYKREKDVVKSLEDVLGIEIEPMSIAGVRLPGSVAVANDHGVFVHADATDEEMTMIKEILNVERITNGYINGSPYVSVGLVANNKGVVIGDETSPTDIMYAAEALLGNTSEIPEI